MYYFKNLYHNTDTDCSILLKFSVEFAHMTDIQDQRIKGHVMYQLESLIS